MALATLATPWRAEVASHLRPLGKQQHTPCATSDLAFVVTSFLRRKPKLNAFILDGREIIRCLLLTWTDSDEIFQADIALASDTAVRY